jgi:prepilin-type N-terminal cleavage/methylation domain-containing protein
MMSRIGNDLKTEGFTLIEVMVAVAVLSFGIVMLYQSFFISSDAVQYASDRLNLQIWMDTKLRQESDALMRAKTLPSAEEGNFKLNNRDFLWRKTAQLIDTDLYEVQLTSLWKESGKERTLTYATYLSP